jgi:hypothetical protein
VSGFTVEIRSAIAPPFRAELGELVAGAAREGPPSLFVRLIRPAITFTHPWGVLRKAPAGEPGPWQLGAALVAGVVVLLLALAVVGAASLLRRRR